MEETRSPVELEILQVVPSLSRALTDLRAATSANSTVIRQLGDSMATAIERLQTAVESAVTGLASAVSERVRKENGQAVAQQILSASICALANASASKVNNVEQLVEVWYGGDNGRLGVQARLELRDQMLESKGIAARKLLCRWRRVILVLERVEKEYGRTGAVSRMDKLLKVDKFGLRTLSDNHLAMEETQERWVARLTGA
ncbi:unnamed protein product [Tilletia caries]|nr:unnamed protein product [Tilletia caries]